jgi:hypothetical protein
MADKGLEEIPEGMSLMSTAWFNHLDEAAKLPLSVPTDVIQLL